MEKTVIRTEAAPAPFQGAPYNQAIVAGGLVFVAGQLGLRPGDAAVEGDIAEQTGQALANLAADPGRSGQLDGQARQDQRLPHGPRRLPGDERGLREPRRGAPARPVDVPGRGPPVGRAGRDRGRSAPLRSRARYISPCRADQHPPLRPLARPRRVRRRGRRARRAARDPARGRGLSRPGRRPRRAPRRARAARARRGHGGARPAGRGPLLPEGSRHQLRWCPRGSS